MQWRDLVRPVKAGTVAVARAAVRRATPSPPSTPAAYVSPLQAEVSAIVALKQRVCSLHCVGCTYSAGTVCSLDQRLAKASAERDDPAPYLKDLHAELQATRQDLAKSREDNTKMRDQMRPLNWIRRGVYVGIASGSVSLAVLAFRALVGLP